MDQPEHGGDSSAQQHTEPKSAEQKPTETTTALTTTNTVYPDDPFGSREPEVIHPPAPASAGSGGGSLPPPPDDGDEDEDDDDEGMLRMSFMGHLEELRSRIIRALIGFGVAFLACMVFSQQLWNIVQAPLAESLKGTNGKIIAIDPMEQFSIIWIWTPLVASLFVAAPWVVYQVWAFIAPGLYKKERRWAVPFITCTAGLFLLGG